MKCIFISRKGKNSSTCVGGRFIFMDNLAKAMDKTFSSLKAYLLCL